MIDDDGEKQGTLPLTLLAAQLPSPPRERLRLHTVSPSDVRDPLSAVDLRNKLSPELSSATHAQRLLASRDHVEASIAVRLRGDGALPQNAVCSSMASFGSRAVSAASNGSLRSPAR